MDANLFMNDAVFPVKRTHKTIVKVYFYYYYYYYYYIPNCKPQLGEPDAKNPKAPAGKTSQ